MIWLLVAVAVIAGTIGFCAGAIVTGFFAQQKAIEEAEQRHLWQVRG